jgi:hypothetical protein
MSPKIERKERKKDFESTKCYFGNLVFSSELKVIEVEIN